MSGEIPSLDWMNDTSLILSEENHYLSKLSFDYEYDASCFSGSQYYDSDSIYGDSLNLRFDEEPNMFIGEEIPYTVGFQDVAKLNVSLLETNLAMNITDESMSMSSASLKVGQNDRPATPNQSKLRSMNITMNPFNSVSDGINLFSSIPKKKFNPSYKRNQRPAKPKCCNCKKSKCLKLYCNCFANNRFCQNCKCPGCCNVAKHHLKVEKARKLGKQKNPLAIKRQCSEKDAIICKCSRSACLKKYCECFKAGKKCGSTCNCIGCENKSFMKIISYNDCGKVGKKIGIEI